MKRKKKLRLRGNNSSERVCLWFGSGGAAARLSGSNWCVDGVQGVFVSFVRMHQQKNGWREEKADGLTEEDDDMS